MPLRTVVLFNVGPPFGGFRLAVAPGVFGLNSPAAFEALERALGRAVHELRAHPPDTWVRLCEQGLGAESVPRLGDREGVVDLTGNAANDTAGDVALRAFLPFAAWPLGGWAVYDAWHRSADGVWTPFGHDELTRLW